MALCMARDFGEAEIAVRGPVEIGVVDDEGRPERRLSPSGSIGDLAEEVDEREQRYKAPCAQPLAERLSGLQLFNRVRNPIGAYPWLLPGDPDRDSAARGEDHLISTHSNRHGLVEPPLFKRQALQRLP
jgi:hypothetical protein